MLEPIIPVIGKAAHCEKEEKERKEEQGVRM